MILVLSDLWLPFPGGAERLMFNLARHLQRRGQQVIVATGYEPAQQFDGPRVVHLDLTEGAPVLRGFIRGANPDVILTHHYWAFTFEDELRRAGANVVQVVLNGHRLPFAALAVYISEYVRSQPDKTPQPGDLTITPPAFPDVIAEEHGDAIGFIKPLPHKGAELFWQIVEAMPEREFVVLRGEWQDIELLQAPQYAYPNVTLMEPVDDIRDFYRRCRVVLMPSLSEDAGTVAQECALNAIPCISSDVGGLRETNAGGLQTSSRDPAVWVSAIERLDDPRLYDAAVIDMREHYAAVDHAGLLDVFADRVHELAR